MTYLQGSKVKTSIDFNDFSSWFFERLFKFLLIRSAQNVLIDFRFCGLKHVFKTVTEKYFNFTEIYFHKFTLKCPIHDQFIYSSVLLKNIEKSFNEHKNINIIFQYNIVQNCIIYSLVFTMCFK